MTKNHKSLIEVLDKVLVEVDVQLPVLVGELVALPPHLLPPPFPPPLLLLAAGASPVLQVLHVVDAVVLDHAVVVQHSPVLLFLVTCV